MTNLFEADSLLPKPRSSKALSTSSLSELSFSKSRDGAVDGNSSDTESQYMLHRSLAWSQDEQDIDKATDSMSDDDVASDDAPSLPWAGGLPSCYCSFISNIADEQGMERDGGHFHGVLNDIHWDEQIRFDRDIKFILSKPDGKGSS